MLSVALAALVALGVALDSPRHDTAGLQPAQQGGITMADSSGQGTSPYRGRKVRKGSAGPSRMAAGNKLGKPKAAGRHDNGVRGQVAQARASGRLPAKMGHVGRAIRHLNAQGGVAANRRQAAVKAALGTGIALGDGASPKPTASKSAGPVRIKKPGMTNSSGMGNGKMNVRGKSASATSRTGTPPGLAKKGGQPPGQAKKNRPVPAGPFPTTPPGGVPGPVRSAPQYTRGMKSARY